MPARAPKTVTVAFRVPEETDEALDAQARSLGVKKSVLLRSIVETALGNEPRMQLINETLFSLKPLLLRAVTFATRAVEERLPELIAEELSELEAKE